ncbi:Rv3654c family TadE-like protein [Kitasatospora sp. NPDC047058]|uniref:Rv3654c family TadE-like protein n=1 Tax=Kitasatospora sp. NPDC047058 TaxID=3155620 RepID=UPI0033E8F756
MAVLRQAAVAAGKGKVVRGAPRRAFHRDARVRTARVCTARVRRLRGWAVRGRTVRAAASGRRGDAGSATVWLVAFAVLGCAAFTATLAVGAVAGARHRAESAADLAALAAADRLLLDVDGGCGRAAGIAAAQAATVVSCTVDREADAVEVVAEVPVDGLPVRLPVGPARARSRAGPVRATATAAAADVDAAAEAGAVAAAAAAAAADPGLRTMAGGS